MKEQKQLDLVILWHMHQPDFRDHARGEFVQPWVYLHATKDYSDMAAHLEAHPQVRVVLNFTPVLLDQLEDYTEQFASGRFRDPLLRLLAQPDLGQIDQAARDFILATCFKANVEKLIEPYPAYKRLYEFFRLAQEHGESGASYLSTQYLGDLLSWYHIAWMGETVRRQEEIVPALIAKGHGFTHAERMQLLAIVGREVSNVIPRYRKLFEQGRIELRNFGVFAVKQRKGRKARNPRTNESVEVPPKCVVTFKPGKEMEERVRQMTHVPEGADEDDSPERDGSPRKGSQFAKAGRARKATREHVANPD